MEIYDFNGGLVSVCKGIQGPKTVLPFSVEGICCLDDKFFASLCKNFFSYGKGKNNRILTMIQSKISAISYISCIRSEMYSLFLEYINGLT